MHEKQGESKHIYTDGLVQEYKLAITKNWYNQNLNHIIITKWKKLELQIVYIRRTVNRGHTFSLEDGQLP